MNHNYYISANLLKALNDKTLQKNPNIFRKGLSRSHPPHPNAGVKVHTFKTRLYHLKVWKILVQALHKNEFLKPGKLNTKQGAQPSS